MPEVESSLLDLMAGSSALTGWGSFPLPHLSATRLLSKEKIDFGATVFDVRYFMHEIPDIKYFQ
jgi:hypothetical protein